MTTPCVQYSLYSANLVYVLSLVLSRMTESNTRVLVAVLVVLLVLFMVAKGQDCTLDRYDLTTVQK